MRWQFLLIIIPVVLLVIFGKNPIKEEEMRWRQYGDDPLVAAINMHNEKVDKERSFSFGWLGFGTPSEQRRTSDRPADDFTELDLSRVRPSHSPGNTLPPHAANDNYYPPVVKNDAPAINTDITKTPSHAKLRSGQPIWFDGLSVYTADTAGTGILLPNGDYTLFDGSSITVRDGKRSAY